jgi:hypothetical protein
VSQSKEAIRDLDPTRFLDGFLHNVRFSIRSLRRTPVFSLALVLAVGIGVTAAVEIVEFRFQSSDSQLAWESEL